MSVFRMPKYGLRDPKTHIRTYEKRSYLGPRSLNFEFSLTYPIVFIPKEDDKIN